MAWTLSQLTALETAIAGGTLTVRYADKQVTYRSLDEMLRLRDMMRKELGLVGDGSASRIKTKFGKGLD